jgi:hypothetical protein
VTSVGPALAGFSKGRRFTRAAPSKPVVSDDVGGLDRVAANERLFLGLASARRGDAVAEFACECTGRVCDQRVAVTADEYEPVRASAARYVVFPTEGHVDETADVVIDRQPLFWVVERRPSVEVLAFYSRREQTITSDLTALARVARTASDADAPGMSSVPELDDQGDDTA